MRKTQNFRPGSKVCTSYRIPFLAADWLERFHSAPSNATVRVFVVGPTKVVFVFLSQRFFLCPGSKRLYTTWVFFSRSLSKRALFPAARGFFFLGGRTYVYDEIKGCKIDPNQVAKSHLSAFIRLMSYLSFFLRFLSLSPSGFFFSEGDLQTSTFPKRRGFFF